jgi:hypothetical protein
MPTVAQLFKILPPFYGTLMLNVVFAKAFYWALSWATSIGSTSSNQISLTSSLILTSQLRREFLRHFFHFLLISPVHRMCYVILVVYLEGWNSSSEYFLCSYFLDRFVDEWWNVWERCDKEKGREWTKIFDSVTGWRGLKSASSNKGIDEVFQLTEKLRACGGGTA